MIKEETIKSVKTFLWYSADEVIVIKNMKLGANLMSSFVLDLIMELNYILVQY